MKKFFHDYSYSVVKMFINQLAIAIFGSSLAFATTAAYSGDGFDTFTLIVSIFSTLFYLFLIYNLSWEIGAKDRIAVDVKKKPYRPWLGFFLSFLANIPNFIIITIYAISGSGIMSLITRLTNGMYWGSLCVISIPQNGTWIPLQTYWWAFLIATLPAILTSGMAYYCGHKNFKFFGFITDKKPATTIDRPNMK